MAARLLARRAGLVSSLKGQLEHFVNRTSDGAASSSTDQLLSGHSVRSLQQSVAAVWARNYASLPEHTMPALSPTMAQGNVNSWEVKEGDELEAGTILATIETDKATLEWENQEDGFLAKILVEAGTKDVAVGTPLAVVVENQEDVDKFKDYQSSGGKSAASGESSSQESEPQADAKESRPEEDTSTNHRQSDGNERIGPAARLLMHEHHLSASDIKATGPFGIITKGDVLAALEKGTKSAPKEQGKPAQKAESRNEASDSIAKSQERSKSSQPQQSSTGAATPAQGDKFVDVQNSQIRRIIAQRLLESKQTVPHYYVKAAAALDGVNGVRESLKSQGIKVSLNDFVVRAVALALAEVPSANSMWDSKSEEVRRLESVDVAIAVATDKGLITPILKNANTKSLSQISGEIRELAGRARANKLKPDEFQGGTFTISNLGMFGIDSFSAIINPPQAGILAVGGTQHKVVLENGKPVSKAQMNVVLSGDQRVFDGQTAHKFLSALCSNLENPVKLIV